MFWALFFSYFLSPLFAQNNANDAPVYLPTEYVEATPLASFDEKTYLWPSQKIQPQTFQSSSIYESLNKSPGVQTQGETSGGSPSIRIRGSGSITRNIILLDGTPLQAQDGIGTNPLLLPHESLESMEIIKGPASLFYGADSVGGALNLKTKTYDRPTLRLGAETSNKYSSYFASPLIKNGNHFLQSSLYLEDGKNDYSYDSPTNGQAKRDNNQRTKQRYTLSGKNKLSRVLLTHQLLYAKEHGQSPGAVSTSPYITDFSRTAYLGALGADIKLNTGSQLKTKLSYLQTESDNIESGAESEYKISKTYASVNYSYDVSSVLSFQVFTDFIYDTYKNTPTLSRKYSEDRYEHGAVLQYQLSDIDKIMAGFRFFPDQNEFVKNIMLSQDRKSYIVYASYSEGIQVPSFNQKYNDAYGMVPNPNLDVEKSSQVEIGLEKPSQKYSSNIWKKTHLKLSLFTIDYKNFIEYNASNSPFSYLNSGAVKSQGVEISAEYDFSIYNIYAAYSFLDTEIKDQNRSVAVTPEHQAYLLTGAMLGPIVLELHNTFWSEYRSDSSSDNRESSWVVTDFTIRTVELNDWHFKMGILNIFDKERVFTRFGTDYYPSQADNTLYLLKDIFDMKLLALTILLLTFSTYAKQDLRIVSFSPALTEILYSLGLGEYIVGTTTFSDYPEDAKKIPRIGSYFQPNFEKTLSLRPTHVLAMKEGDSAIFSYLKKSKLKYYIFESRSLANFSNNMIRLGEIFSVQSHAKKITKEWESHISGLPQINKSILIQVDHNPIITAGKDTFLSEALEKCGLQNKLITNGYQKTSLETLSKLAPDFLLVVGQLNAQTKFEDVKNFWLKNPFFKNTKIIHGDADKLSRLGPRFAIELARTCREISNL